VEEGEVGQEVLLLDGASLCALVRMLCPALDTLLALTPGKEGRKMLVWLPECSRILHATLKSLF
jgi:hypothetical protein